MAQDYTPPFKIKTSLYNSQARKLMLNVYYFMQKVKKRPEYLKLTPTELAAKALNVSTKTIKRFHKTGGEAPEKRQGGRKKVLSSSLDDKNKTGQKRRKLDDDTDKQELDEDEIHVKFEEDIDEEKPDPLEEETTKLSITNKPTNKRKERHVIRKITDFDPFVSNVEKKFIIEKS